MFSFLDLAIFLFLTAFAFGALSMVSFFRRKIERRGPQLSRDPLKVKIGKKAGIGAVSERFDFWLIQTLRRGNIQLDRVAALLLILCPGIGAAAIAFGFDLPVVFQITIAVLVVFVGFSIYYLIMWRRMSKFNSQLPAGLELLARSARAGESIESAFQIAGAACEQPLKGEFQYCRKQLELGLTVDIVALELADRIGSPDSKLFAHTIAIHRSIGGQLANSLERLSKVIRQRSELAEKIKSATGIGRFAVVAIVSMGILVLFYLLLMEPDYVGRLTQSDLGNRLIIYGVISEIIGLSCVGWTLRTEP